MAVARGGDRSVGVAALGGPFKLVNHLGKETTEKDFLGSFALLYFGFTHCPDICPEELVKICEAIDIVGASTALSHHTTAPDPLWILAACPTHDGGRCHNTAASYMQNA